MYLEPWGCSAIIVERLVDMKVADGTECWLRGPAYVHILCKPAVPNMRGVGARGRGFGFRAQAALGGSVVLICWVVSS